MNLKQLHSNIVDIIETAGFRYITADKWFNIELGQFPKALVNDSFSIRFTSKTVDARIHGFSALNVEIEFVLNSSLDKYLDVLDSAVEAVKNLKDVTVPDYGKIISPPKGDFAAQYMQEFISITFSDIRIEVN